MHFARAPIHRAQQRGAATLAVSLVLLFAMLMTAAYAHRSLLLEQRLSANQYREAQAFEAAQSGIDWAVAQLNQARPVNDRCEPGASAASRSFRERFLASDTASGRHDPRRWDSGSQSLALQPGCLRTAGAWSCACPSSGFPQFPATATDDNTPHPAFSVQFSAEPLPGLVRLIATGCSNAAGPCRPGHDSRADAVVRLQVLLALLPGVSVLPQAALTARESVDAGDAALGLHNADAASGGVSVHAGGSLIGTALRLGSAPGSPAQASASTHDAALAALTPDRLFAAQFGLDRASWRRHGAVQQLDCSFACGARLAAAIDAKGSNRMISIDGDATLDGPITLGSPEQPVVMVVHGAVVLNGDVTVHGLLYAASIRWDAASGPQASVHGAVVSESGYAGNGAPDLHRDAGVLRALQAHTGSFAQVPGSWKDF
jgi:hypothetical protein